MLEYLALALIFIMIFLYFAVVFDCETTGGAMAWTVICIFLILVFLAALWPIGFDTTHENCQVITVGDSQNSQQTLISYIDSHNNSCVISIADGNVVYAMSDAQHPSGMVLTSVVDHNMIGMRALDQHVIIYMPQTL